MSSYDELPVRTLPSGMVVAGAEPVKAWEYDPYSAPWQPQKSDEGWQDRLTFANPAAGTDWIHTCPGDVVEEILTVRFKFVTSAVVANRIPFLQIIDQNNGEIWGTPPSTQQGASLSILYNYSSSTGAAQALISNRVAVAMTRIFLFPQWQLRTVTAALDAGDQFSEIAIVANRWRNRPRRIAAAH